MIKDEHRSSLTRSAVRTVVWRNRVPLLACDQHRTVSVVNDVVADATDECASDSAHSARSHHDHPGVLVGCLLHDELSWVGEVRHHFTLNLVR